MALAAEARLGRRLSSAAEAKALDGGRALAEPAEGGRARGPIAPSRSDSHEVHRVQDFDEQVFQSISPHPSSHGQELPKGWMED
ncbi:zinc finger protein 789 isoform X12 [Equus asinus]|uniref:zinc finger protein 789 isoform X12 n=1 Tax=Equus asinus TaxID=9793 RepID=UPI0038F702E4